MNEIDYRTCLWRIGRKIGRTIYAQLGNSPSDDDPVIGLMDTVQLATEAVLCHNRELARDRSHSYPRVES